MSGDTAFKPFPKSDAGRRTVLLQLYTRRTEDHDRILDALGDLPTPAADDDGTDDSDDEDPGTAGLPVPTP